jgi:adenylate cyclase
MSDAALNLAVIVGWPVAPIAMGFILLGWRATAYLWDGGGFGRPSGRLHRRHCLAEWHRVREEFGRYVGEEVARRALQHDTEIRGQERDVAVLFVDLVGSTALITHQRPGEIVELLNGFFQVVVDVVHRHGGFINKFQGDAALAVFGAPLEHPDGSGAALAAARELRDELVFVLGSNGFGIGVSAGRAFAGEVGARNRLEYTVIGDAVNEAARLTELAKTEGGHVLASATTVGDAQDTEALSWDLGELVQLRGRDAPTRLARPAAQTRAIPRLPMPHIAGASRQRW